jgi:uncharacterized protein YgbK (DUF1537 family)
MFDAETGADLDAIVACGRAARAPVLWCGSAGLAGALAGFAGEGSPTPLAMPATIIVGSHHAVSRDQVAAVKAADAAEVLAFGADEGAWDGVIAQARRAARPVVLWFSPAQEMAAERAEATMTNFFDRLSAGFRPPGALIVTGGETLARLCRAARATRLVARREAAPGIAQARIADGRWGGLSLISKSGAFGATDFFVATLRKGSL